MKALDEPIDLSPGDVSLWLCFVDEKDETLDPQELAVLAEDERERLYRFHFLRDRRRFLKTRLLSREVLGRCLGRPPSTLRFGTDPHGRPYLVDQVQHAAGPLVFNLSHTPGLVALAVRRGAALGVDAELLDRSVDIGLARRVFSRSEVHALRRIPAPQQGQRFLDIWTLKETYVKARGLGLQIPLGQISFDFASDPALALHFEAGCCDDPQRWQLWQCHPRNSHTLALCAERRGNDRAAPRLRAHEIEPLRWWRPAALTMTRGTCAELPP